MKILTSIKKLKIKILMSKKKDKVTGIEFNKNGSLKVHYTKEFKPTRGSKSNRPIPNHSYKAKKK